MEVPTMFDQGDQHSVEGMAEYMDQSNRVDLIKHLGAPFFVEGDTMHDLFGPEMYNYHLWLRKIKQALDPNGVADSGYYISAKPKKPE